MQALHSTDKSERFFRIIIEAAAFVLAVCAFVELGKVATITAIVSAFVVTHTLLWFLTGNFWVYMLDSFLLVRNPGMVKIISFVELTKRWFTFFDSAETILIYGSMCRRQFHNRSDLDLRVLRRRDSFIGLLALPVGFILRAYSFFIMLPVDLEVVDSAKFLEKQMRKDEAPIVVYQRDSFSLPHAGMDFSEIRNNPQLVMRDKIRSAS